MQFLVVFCDCLSQPNSHSKPWVPLALFPHPGLAKLHPFGSPAVKVICSPQQRGLFCHAGGCQGHSGDGTGRGEWLRLWTCVPPCCPEFNLILATIFIVQLRESWVTGESGRGVVTPCVKVADILPVLLLCFQIPCRFLS